MPHFRRVFWDSAFFASYEYMRVTIVALHTHTHTDERTYKYALTSYIPKIRYLITVTTGWPQKHVKQKTKDYATEVL